MPQTKCVLCSKRLKLHQRRPVNKTIQKYLWKHFLLESKNQDWICSKCSRAAYPQHEQPAHSYTEVSFPSSPDPVPISSQLQSPPSVRLNIKSTTKSHAYCFICKKPGPKLIVVPSCVRTDTFLEHDILITADSRCCPVHLNSTLNKFESSVISGLKTNDHLYMNRTSILQLLNKTKELLLESSSRRLTFDNLDIFTNEDLVNLTGITKEQFLDLHSQFENEIRNTQTRSTETTLGIFLFKLKSGVSNKLLSTLFNISKSSIRRAIITTRKALMVRFVPQNLGFSHITRDEVITMHTRKLAQNLLANSENQAILVLDGTYIYINKSNNFQFQRRSYSLHKGRPLVKIMMIVSTTGYFITALGPYFADTKNNDASILSSIMTRNLEEIKQWIQAHDVFVVDRGFRDAVHLLHELGIQAEIPSFLNRGDKQMKTEDANASRLVTKVRWVVEAANARLKCWKYLCHILPTNQVPFIGDYVRIVCSLCNKYLPAINATKESDEMIASQMLDRLSRSNELQSYVESNNLERRNISKWSNVEDCNLSDFPVLNETILRVLTLGTYQLKLSTSYIQEYIGGDCNFQLYNEAPDLLRVRLQSRHVSSKSYLVWIKYDSDHVKAWYCKCKAGARTVGTCSHVAAVLWYLGLAIHMDKNRYGVQDWGRFLEDAADIPQSVDVSDSEESTVEE